MKTAFPSRKEKQANKQKNKNLEARQQIGLQKKNQKQRTKQTKEINKQKNHPNINCGARTCDSLHMFYRHLRLRPTS